MFKIEHNGSKFSGQEPEPLEYLLDLLAREPLRPLFERYGRFESAAIGDDGPNYPEAPDARRFWGNFENLSSGFAIVTDEPEQIERLRAAIRENMGTAAYKEARDSWTAEEARELQRRKLWKP